MKAIQHSPSSCSTFARLLALLLCALVGCCLLAGCNEPASGETPDDGKHFAPKYHSAAYHAKKAIAANGCTIDTSDASKGYVSATGKSSSRLKLVVSSGNMSYNYDMSKKGDPIIVPLNMGDGTYLIQVMKNTSGKNYIALASTSVSVNMKSKFAPFVRPNVFCNYNKESECVKKAADLARNAKDDADFVGAVYEYIVRHIRYDNDKARKLAKGSGYVPDPDETLRTGKGICLDYSSLAAAMLRSQGVPCKIMTGNVYSQGEYHAWNMIWVNGTWESVEISLKSKEWTRVDTTYAASRSVEDLKYTDRYTY